MSYTPGYGGGMKSELGMKKPKFGFLKRRGKGTGKPSTSNFQLPTFKEGRVDGLMAHRSQVDDDVKIGGMIFDLTKGSAYSPLSVL
jgi:hypothetical protein